MIDNLLLLFQSPPLFLQVLIDGVLIGAVLALPAYGMALVWGVMNIINIAQGEFVMLGGYITFVLFFMLGIHPLYGIVVSFIGLYITGWVIYRIVIFRVVDRDLFISILATFGISIILQQAMNLIFDSDIQTADPGMESWSMMDNAIVVAPIRVLAFVLVFVLGGILMVYMRKSRMGRAIRATAQNARAARIMGVDTDRVYATTYALNAAICGAAGALVVMTWVIQPFLGLLYTVRSFLIVIVAGVGNIGGVVAAALGLGAVENFAGFVLGTEFQVAFVYLLMVVILVWRNHILKRSRQYLSRVAPAINILDTGAIAVAGLAAPFLFPTFVAQFAFVWLFILFAQTWDAQGGQMGYNSFGNVLYFGIGMYVCTVVLVGVSFNVAEFTAPGGEKKFVFTTDKYVIGLILGTIAGAIAATLVAALLGSGILGLRGHYFAIATLGLGIAAGELAAGWEFIGAGSGIAAPVFPDAMGDRATFFYFVFFALSVIAFFTYKWLYRGRFGLAINAIRDDEDRAESMGLPTTRYKTTSWMVSAFFLGLAGGPVGLFIGFIDPRDTAFAGVTFGVWMVLMAILGGKGTLWGPVIGAIIFIIFKEVFWVFLLGWQQVALGLLIVVIVVFFPMGIMGWIREKYPELLGHEVEEKSLNEPAE